jgi:serine/threonine protein kinase
MPPFEVPGYTYVRPLNEPRWGGDWVLLARRQVDGTEVALRLFNRRLRGFRDRQRFEHEVAGLKALVDVPHVLPLQDAGIDADGRAHVVMAYCQSGSLHDHLTNVGRLTATETRRLGAKLAAALASVHQRDIFHRNVSPSNVLLDAAGEPALADFSLVALTMSEGDFRPDPDRDLRLFLAPEAYLPELMTAEADIYSLGVTLYTLLAGGTPADYPIDGERLMDLPRVPWPLMAALRRAMALDPADRFADARDFRAALLASA